MRLGAAAALCALLAACSPGAGDAGTAAGDAVVNDTASPAPEAAPTAAEFLAAQAEQARLDSAEYAARAGSMGSYADCMRQVRDLDSAGAARIREACGRLPDAPR
ncbi:MAG TPA: hypothetical protein VK928_11215 [Longimicrobiales bacterium]|nr:hypothetical protein [Longimicrobiales bacterium]